MTNNNVDYSSYSSSELDTKADIKNVEKNINYMKNISPFMSKDLIAAAGFNVKAPIVEAIIGNLMGTFPTKKNEAEIIKCQICDCELSSNSALNIHTNGLRHKKRLKAREIIAQLKEAKDNVVPLKWNCENPKTFKCEICSKTVNSAQQLEIHLSGAKHKRKAVRAGIMNTAANPLGRNLKISNRTESCSKTPAVEKKENELKLTSCDICKVFVNSHTQYNQHLLSKRHIMKARRTKEVL